MSKITFRADDDLVEQLESLDASKSEAMREALRSYLEADDATGGSGSDSESERDQDQAIEDVIRERVDEQLAARLGEGARPGTRYANGHGREVAQSPEPQDVNVTISLEGAVAQSDGQSQTARVRSRETADGDQSVNRPREQTGSQPHDRDGARQCNQCGDHLNGDHVYCPNCGEKASRRLFCDCGDEIRSDWSFCPGCGRRTPAADVLESDGTQY
ncbi:ribbon-helix-helix protein, CopG family [Natrinema halophilum]|uniref:CopG family transcriptional regulator n=1 Tax=Natrinema halophilum TaxID=1699371 RepID=A0A7D5KCM2_9EURY|nr:ribbon-helix-helix protein, CopG family [Natrinema halophilum]QLG48741.1 ribbon-helix-helix protein, CopG family [Natrinema halophilum]